MFLELDKNEFKGSTKRPIWKLLLLIGIPVILIIVVVVVIVLLVTKKKTKETPEEEEEEEDVNVDPYLIADLQIVNGSMVNTGLKPSIKITNYTLTGDSDGSFQGGVLRLDQSYKNGTLVAILKEYNTSSTDRVFKTLAYYGGGIDFREFQGTGSEYQRTIGISYGGGYLATKYVFPEHNYKNKYYDGKMLVEGQDIYAAVTTNSLGDKTGGLFAVQINDDYHEKARWCESLPYAISLSSNHTYKEIRVFNKQLHKKSLLVNFKNTTNIITESDDFTIDNYTNVNNGIDNSKYESIHIVKKPTQIYVGYRYSLAAVPYPFNINYSGKADQYDVSWESSDKNIATVVDGLVMTKSEGTVTITATLIGTSLQDSVTILVKKHAVPVEKIKMISKNYKSKNGNSFSKSDYNKTTGAIYDAIQEAFEEGYNHVIFPKMKFYATPNGTSYYIPTEMTVEFPEGSEFHMMPNYISLNKGYTYFSMGWKTWDRGGYFHNIPKEIATVEYGKSGQPTGYYIQNAHLIIDKYFGEFYKEKATIQELAKGANENQFGCVFLNIVKNARYCSVEIHTANATSGEFMGIGGATYANEIKNAYKVYINYTDFINGRINDEGVVETNKYWISTNSFYEITTKLDGTDYFAHFCLANIYSSSTETHYHYMDKSTNHLYDIAWYDANKTLMQVDRWHYVDDTYDRPDGAVYYKISMQQEELPTSSDCSDKITYVYFMPAGGAVNCEVKNTKIFHSADGLLSITGETENFWIHDNYLYNDGYLYGWSLDLEDGWYGIRGTILENNIFRKYTFNLKRNFSYTGADTGILALSGGFNTFVISNYVGAVQQTNYNVANSHVIHNTIGSVYGYYNSTDQKFYGFRSTGNAHIYSNVIGMDNMKYVDTTPNGHVYFHDNYIDVYANSLSWVDSMFDYNKL